MTVILGKTHINLGWGTATSIIIFLAVTMWGAGAFTTRYLQKQDDIYKVVMALSKNDTLNNGRIERNTRNIANCNGRIDSINKAGNNTHYYTERRVNGRLIFERKM